ncbi:MORN repeat-containing protein [Herbaspirillum chlorophenolicum]|uniref:MORN repeat-containing protein n=1 Tax=Herbaspirillum chlorophenolicum TaxID=211589 RepID=UPI0009E38FB3|nr:hypothetical protein [Herbaspirillum chlorophenolicum]
MKIISILSRLSSLAVLVVIAACGTPYQPPPTSAAPSAPPPGPPDWTLSSGGCKVWNNGPRPTDSVTWDGECVNGMAEGKGTVTWFNNGVYSQRFVGVMKEGKRSGTGDYYWANGDHYSGQFSNDDRTGKGEYRWGNGDRYSGNFLRGQRDGVSTTYVFANGDRFDGEQRNSSFINGNLVNSSGEVIASFIDGKRYNRSNPNNSSASSSGSSGGGFGALLGAVAQGMAAAGGKNAAQYQALANGLNGNAATGGGGSGGVNPAYTAPVAGAAASSGDSTQPMVNQCMKFSRKGKYEMRIDNSCGYDLSTVYCYTSIANASQYFDVTANACTSYRRSSSANIVISANGFITVNAPNNNNPVKFIACKLANDGYPTKLQWDGNSLQGECHFRASTSSGGARSFGAVR